MVKSIVIVLGFCLLLFSCLGPQPVSETRLQGFNLKEAQVGDRVSCPVDPEKIFEVKSDSLYVEINGKKYYVCCPECTEKLVKDPNRYLSKEVK